MINFIHNKKIRNKNKNDIFMTYWEKKIEILANDFSDKNQHRFYQNANYNLVKKIGFFQKFIQFDEKNTRKANIESKKNAFYQFKSKSEHNLCAAASFKFQQKKEWKLPILILLEL